MKQCLKYAMIIFFWLFLGLTFLIISNFAFKLVAQMTIIMQVVSVIGYLSLVSLFFGVLIYLITRGE